MRAECKQSWTAVTTANTILQISCEYYQGRTQFYIYSVKVTGAGGRDFLFCFVFVFVLFYKSTEPTTAVFCCFCTDNELHSSENFRTNQTYYSALQLHLNCYECIRFPPIFFQVGGRLISNQVGVNIDFEIVFVNQQMFKIVYRRKKILALESF